MPSFLTPVFNHLWQSTLFALAMALLALAFRKNHARTRYALWLAASLKFLLPFSLLVAAGDLIQWRTAPIPRQPAAYFSAAIESVTQPFSASAAPHARKAASAPPANSRPAAAIVMWSIGFAAILFTWSRRYRRVTMALRDSRPLPLEASVPVRSTARHLEPGIFGIRRPVLLLPDGITERLSAQQLEAILAHEMCHVRRRDNLAAAVHMAVQSIFWFHPLVWWIGARLVQERELACDEAVLQQGNPPRVYAEGMLNVCRFYLESPLPCVSGVTGSDLRRRIESILNHRIARRLNFAKKLLLASAGFAAVALPISIGLLHAPLGWAQTAQSPPDANPPLAFDVASVKPAAPDQQGRSILFQPGGGVNFTNVPLHMILTFAYDVRDFQVSGEPGWMKSELFDIKAKADLSEPSDLRNMTDAQRLTIREQNRQRTRSLLAERFGLKVHRETKEAPVYALVQAKNGHKLTPNPATDGPQRLGGQRRGQIMGTRVPVPLICQILSSQLGRPVVDQTGLTGLFDFKLEWTPDPSPSIPGDSSESATGSDPGGPSLSAALLEQLGLRLESKKGPVEIIVIDRVSKPTEN